MNDVAESYRPEQPEADDELDLRELVGTLLDEWKWIVGITSAVFLGALFYAVTATPIYRSNALLQVEQKESGLGGLDELSTMLTGEAPAEAEIEIIRSRTVLGNAIEKEGLQVSASPVYYPYVGAAIARRHDANRGPADPLFGLERYAWGGEQIQVDRLDVPRFLQDQTLTLVAESQPRYSLKLDGRVLLSGNVGEVARGSEIEMFVSKLMARPGTEFSVRRVSKLRAVESLGSRLSVNEKGKKTGILQISLEGPDPQRIASTLDQIANVYLRQNVERKSEEAARSLEFLEQQLPELKNQLDAAESALNAYRVQQGSVDLSLETQGLLTQMTEVEKQLSELEIREAEVSQRFTSEHPTMVAIREQRASLTATRNALESQIRSLPAAEQESLRLLRDVRVANELYLLLLNRSQELKVVRAGTVGNVRIIDPAFVPNKTVKPRKTRIALLGIVLGGMLGIFVVFIREALRSTVRDPKDLEATFGLPVYAIVPHSDEQETISKARGRRKRPKKGVLVDKAEDDPAIESLRSFRTSLEFLFLESKRRVITIGGAAPEAGKSFVSVNLAILLAKTGKSVLLIDGDLRRGHLHKMLGYQRSPGLTEWITQDHDRTRAIHATTFPGLHFLSTGALPPNPAEFLISARFGKLVELFEKSYDVIVIDAPPVLAAAESVTLARVAALNFLVVRSEQQTMREVQLAMQKLKQSGAEPKGFIFNDLKAESRRYAYAGYRYYQYTKAPN